MMKYNDFAAFLHLKGTIADVDQIWIGIFALSLTAICSVSEAIRGALLSIDKGQDEAGYSVGLTKIQTIYRIILPQMIPIAIPMLTNHVVGLIKASSVVMAIGIIGRNVNCKKVCYNIKRLYDISHCLHLMGSVREKIYISFSFFE